jgi:hypothetical protein
MLHTLLTRALVTGCYVLSLKETGDAPCLCRVQVRIEEDGMLGSDLVLRHKFAGEALKVVGFAPALLITWGFTRNNGQ